MTPRKQRFIAEYIRLRDGKAAALAAGYAECAAAPMASKLLRRADVQEALIAAGVPLAFSTYGVKQATRIAKGLTARQERFIEHYLVLGKGAEAARRAGYSTRSAPAIADKLLRTPRVAAALSEAQALRAKRMAIDAERVLGELARLGFADLGRVIDWGPQGVRLTPAQELDPIDRAAISEVVAEIGAETTKLKVKLFNKPRALEVLARHLGLLAKPPRGAGEPKLFEGRDPRQVLRERLERIVAAMAKREDDKER